MTAGKIVLFITVAGVAFFGCVKSDATSSSKDLKTHKDKVSYAIGLDIGKSLKQQSLALELVDLNKMKMGIQDAMGEGKPVLTDSQISETMMAFQKEMTTRHDSVQKVQGEANLKISAAFLAKNAKEPGVVTLPSGLQYKILNEGKGPKPTAASTVTVHYAGKLVDGTEFDSSIKRGQPATFPVSGVIKGWTEALQLMPTGSKWQVVIPPELGYGPTGAGKQIGPNSTLIFEVELISIADSTAAAPQMGTKMDPKMNPKMKGHP